MFDTLVENWRILVASGAGLLLFGGPVFTWTKEKISAIIPKKSEYLPDLTDDMEALNYLRKRAIELKSPKMLEQLKILNGLIFDAHTQELNNEKV